MLGQWGEFNKMIHAADPYFCYLDVWLTTFATFLTVQRMLKIITKIYIYDQHIQKIPPKIKQEFNQVIPHFHQFSPHTTSVVTLHFDNSVDPTLSPSKFLHKNLLSWTAEDKGVLWMEFSWYIFTSFEMYPIFYYSNQCTINLFKTLKFTLKYITNAPTCFGFD
jgi:hypothetical protein